MTPGIEDARLDARDRAREEWGGDDDMLDGAEVEPRTLCAWCCGSLKAGTHDECRRQIAAEGRRRTGL